MLPKDTNVGQNWNVDTVKTRRIVSISDTIINGENNQITTIDEAINGVHYTTYKWLGRIGLISYLEYYEHTKYHFGPHWMKYTMVTEEKAKELDGEQEVPIEQLISAEFLSSCSRFNSFSELLEASGFEGKSKEDFKAIPDDEWDQFIDENTSYQSWAEMLQSAVEKWYRNKLGL